MEKNKILLIAGGVLVLAGLVLAGWFYFFKDKPAVMTPEGEITEEEITQSLTAPAQGERPSQAEETELLGGLTAAENSSEASEVTDEILDSLSVPSNS